MDNILTELYLCLDKITSAMCLMRNSKNPKSSTKRLKTTKSRKDERFREDLNVLRSKWHQIMQELFFQLTDTELYHKIATDITKAIYSTRVKFGINLENSCHVVKCLLEPIIGIIMDEEEVNKSSQARQEMRKNFVNQLLSFSIQPNVEQTEEQDSCDSVVDVIAISPSSQICSDNRRLQKQSNSMQNNMHNSNTIRLGQSFYPCEAIQMLDILIQSLSEHSATLSSDSLDVFASIYHIINITHLVDIINFQFQELKIKLRSSEPAWLGVEDIGSLRELVRISEESISKDLDRIDVGNSFIVYRNDLRSVLVRILTLKSILRK